MKIALQQTDYWDRVAEKKRFSHNIDWDVLSPLLKPSPKVLDYGCGYGRLTAKIVEKGYAQTVGMDSSEGMIERAKREFPGLSFQHNNEQQIGFPDDHFDLITLFAVLTCIPLETDQLALIKELKRVLKPGGLLYVSDVLLNEDQRNLDRYNSKTAEQPYGVFALSEGVLLRHHSMEYLSQTALAAFDVLFETEFEVTTMNGNASRAGQLIGQKP